jgi:hypothetical protein
VGLSLLDRVLGLWNADVHSGRAVPGCGLTALLVARSAFIGDIAGGRRAVLVCSTTWLTAGPPHRHLQPQMPRGFWSNAIFQFADYIRVFFQVPPLLMGVCC